MSESNLDSPFVASGKPENAFDTPASHLRQEYEEVKELLGIQPPLVQRFFKSQGRLLAEAMMKNPPQMRFSFPDRVVYEPSAAAPSKTISVPENYREQMAGGIMDRLTRTDLRGVLRQRLAELEQSSSRAVAVCSRLTRFATAVDMVHNMLPVGRSVTYVAAEGEEIPSVPLADEFQPESAITATTDAIVGEELQSQEEGRGELLVPYVPAARRFFLPQWVAFDEKGNLIVGSTGEAEAHIASMQRYLDVLHAAVALAPYMVADSQYQQKRYGILGQLVNQGRALAIFQTGEIIQTIKRRAAAHDLNRGLSLSLPYFDDQDLVMNTHDFVIIPAGRIMFIPAFVVRAAREEAVKIAQHTRLSHSTRKYLLVQLKLLEEAFDISDPNK